MLIVNLTIIVENKLELELELELFSRGWIFLNVLNEIPYQSTLVKIVQVAAKFKERGNHKISIYPALSQLPKFSNFPRVIYKSFSLVRS